MGRGQRVCYLCSNNKRTKSLSPLLVDANNAALSFHQFPTRNAEIRSQWIEACGLYPEDDVSRLKICSKHFNVDDYIDVNARKFTGVLTLKPGRVPTTRNRHKSTQSIRVIFLPETPLTILTESLPVITTENITNDVDFEVPVAPEYSDCTPMSPDPGDLTDFETQYTKPKKAKYRCKFPGCNSWYYTNATVNKHFFRFPQNPLLCQKWREVCKVDPTIDNIESYRICSDHFAEKDFVNEMKDRLIYGTLPKYDPTQSERESTQELIQTLENTTVTGETPELTTFTQDINELETELPTAPPDNSIIDDSVIICLDSEEEIEPFGNNESPEIEEPKTNIKSVKILTENDGTTEVCRICLKAIPRQFTSRANLISKLNYLFPEFKCHIYPNPNVCLSCSRVLSVFVNFKKTLLKSEEILENYVTKTLPTGKSLEIIIVPPDLEKNAIALYGINQKEAPPSPHNPTNEEPAPAIEPKKVDPLQDHTYHNVSRFRPIESVETILDTEGLSAINLRKMLSKWKHKDHWGKPPYLCEHCGRIFPNLRTYQGHLNSHKWKRLGNIMCEVCGVSVRYIDRNAHSLKHKAKNHKCTMCSKAYFTSVGLRKHVETTHPDGMIRMVPCEICGAYVKNHSLKTHIKYNHTNRPFRYKCEVCGKGFHVKSRLALHVKKHMDTKWKCEYCGRVMKHQQNLKIHLDTFHFHSGKYTCEICKKMLFSKGVLRRHMENVHGKPKVLIDCHICNQEVRATAYNVHLMQHAKNIAI